jgi:response regulator RpfG family c-di-GMP phosphodiesterase
VPNGILSKFGSLTAEELAVIRRHPELGAQILERASADAEQVLALP